MGRRRVDPGLLMFGVTSLVYAVDGTPSCSCCIGSLLLLLALWLLMMVEVAPEWSAGSLTKRRRIMQAVRDLEMLPGPDRA